MSLYKYTQHWLSHHANTLFFEEEKNCLHRTTEKRLIKQERIEIEDTNCAKARKSLCLAPNDRYSLKNLHGANQIQQILMTHRQFLNLEISMA